MPLAFALAFLHFLCHFLRCWRRRTLQLGPATHSSQRPDHIERIARRAIDPGLSSYVFDQEGQATHRWWVSQNGRMCQQRVWRNEHILGMGSGSGSESWIIEVWLKQEEHWDDLFEQLGDREAGQSRAS